MRLTRPRTPTSRLRRALRQAGLSLLGGAVVTVGVILPAISARAQSDETPPTFSGATSAAGVAMTVDLPGFPITETPVDVTGPTAQVALDSLGSSQGYAAFPYPGDLVITVPGLVTGLAGGGVAGLPPIPLPEAPKYPLFISSDANLTPDAQLGAGPYDLRTSSTAGSGKASATGGLALSGLGNTALVTSTASATTADGGVVFSAATDVQSLTVGPLSIGRVTSTAKATTTGQDVTLSSSMSIAGLQVGGIQIALNPDALELLGPKVPLPINATLKALLATAGIKVDVLAEQRFADRIVSPALQIVIPVQVPGISSGPGTLTMVLGRATAQLSGGPADGPSSSTPDGGAGLDATGSPSAPSFGDPSFGVAPPAVPTPQGASQPPSSIRTEPASTTRTTVGLFDIGSLYLVLAAASIGVWLLGQFVRIVGVRSPWTSIAG